MYTEEEIAKELWMGWMQSSEGLGTLSEDELRGLLKQSVRIAYIAAECFVDYTSEWEE